MFDKGVGRYMIILFVIINVPDDLRVISVMML
jgi:hypothetical protein